MRSIAYRKRSEGAERACRQEGLNTYDRVAAPFPKSLAFFGIDDSVPYILPAHTLANGGLMHETMEFFIWFLITAAVFVLSRIWMHKKNEKVCSQILEDLQEKGAVAPSSAVKLPYANRTWLKFGLRDYRPDALLFLVRSGAVTDRGNGYYYIPQR
jgi:hypothetical protein